MTGHCIAVVYLNSTYKDGNLFIYLEDVDGEGHVQYITEGQIRLIHRKIQSRTEYGTPVRSFLRSDSSPVPVNEVFAVEVELLPTSYLFLAGHSIRIALAGADKDNFAIFPDEKNDGGEGYAIHRSLKYASHIRLPVPISA